MPTAVAIAAVGTPTSRLPVPSSTTHTSTSSAKTPTPQGMRSLACITVLPVSSSTHIPASSPAPNVDRRVLVEFPPANRRGGASTAGIEPLFWSDGGSSPAPTAS